MVDDEAWSRAVYFLYMLFFDIINLYLVTSPVLGVISGQPSRFLKYPVGKFSSAGFDDDVGAGSALGVEPPVISGCKMKGQILVLEIILAHIHVTAVAGQIVEGPAL